MEAVSDVGFRALCFRLGAGFTYTEMIRAQGIARRNKSTLDLIDTFDPSTPTGLQLLVAKPQELLDAVRVLEDLSGSSHPHFHNITAIDLNFGCPSPDVVRMGAGPALLKRRKKLGEIFSALQHIKKTTTLPIKSVSVKIRLGLNEEEMKHKVYVPVVEMANDTVDHIVVHARHAKQRSRDLPTWAAIGEAKAVAKIPVVGNGNVVDQASLTALRTQTGCDAVMVARAAIKNPWSLREMTGAGPAPPPRPNWRTPKRVTWRSRSNFTAKTSTSRFIATILHVSKRTAATPSTPSPTTRTCASESP
jgi:tRNA-dihydrouridine synthase